MIKTGFLCIYLHVYMVLGQLGRPLLLKGAIAYLWRCVSRAEATWFKDVQHLYSTYISGPDPGFQFFENQESKRCFGVGIIFCWLECGYSVRDLLCTTIPTCVRNARIRRPLSPHILVSNLKLVFVELASGICFKYFYCALKLAYKYNVSAVSQYKVPIIFTKKYYYPLKGHGLFSILTVLCFCTM